MLVSAIIGHYDRDRDLARLLRCLLRQTYRPLEILVTADGSPPPRPFLWYGKPVLITDLLLRYGWPVHWLHFERAKSGRPRVAGCINDAVREYASGDIILGLHEDWWIEDAWVEKMVDSLMRVGGPGNHVVGLMKNRRHQIVGGWPYEALVAPLPHPAYVDSGFSSMLFREDWVDFDTDFDRWGFGHGVPFWGWLCAAARQRMWYNSTLLMKHIPHPPDRRAWVEGRAWDDEAYGMEHFRESEALYNAKIAALVEQHPHLKHAGRYCPA